MTFLTRPQSTYVNWQSFNNVTQRLASTLTFPASQKSPAPLLCLRMLSHRAMTQLLATLPRGNYQISVAQWYREDYQRPRPVPHPRCLQHLFEGGEPLLINFWLQLLQCPSSSGLETRWPQRWKCGVSRKTPQL